MLQEAQERGNDAMNNDEKLAAVRHKLEQVLNEMPAESGVVPWNADEKPTYESIASKLDKAIASLAALNERMGLQPEKGSEA